MFYKEKLLNELSKSNIHEVFFGLNKKSITNLKTFLINNDNHFKNCFVYFDEEDEKNVKNICKFCNNQFQKNIICRAYVSTKVMLELMSNFDVYKNRESYINIVNSYIALTTFDYDEIVKNLGKYPSIENINYFQEKVSEIDFNLIVLNIKDKNLQMGINDLLSEKNRLGLKVFTDCAYFCTSKTTEEGFIKENIDYIRKDISLHQAIAEEMHM